MSCRRWFAFGSALSGALLGGVLAMAQNTPLQLPSLTPPAVGPPPLIEPVVVPETAPPPSAGTPPVVDTTVVGPPDQIGEAPLIAPPSPIVQPQLPPEAEAAPVIEAQPTVVPEAVPATASEAVPAPFPEAPPAAPPPTPEQQVAEAAASGPLVLPGGEGGPPLTPVTPAMPAVLVTLATGAMPGYAVILALPPPPEPDPLFISKGRVFTQRNVVTSSWDYRDVENYQVTYSSFDAEDKINYHPTGP